MPHNTFNTLDTFDAGNGRKGQFYSLPKLEKAGVGPISKLPVSIRIVLESVLRNTDGRRALPLPILRVGRGRAEPDQRDREKADSRRHRVGSF